MNNVNLSIVIIVLIFVTIFASACILVEPIPGPPAGPYAPCVGYPPYPPFCTSVATPQPLLP
jgi:hypothetical protein